MSFEQCLSPFLLSAVARLVPIMRYANKNCLANHVLALNKQYAVEKEIFILYSLIIYYLVFSLDIIISDIIFMFSSDLSFKTNINYYITSYINTLKYRFNDNINILDKMELIKFIIWNIIVFVYIVFNFLKTKYDSKIS